MPVTGVIGIKVDTDGDATRTPRDNRIDVGHSRRVAVMVSSTQYLFTHAGTIKLFYP